LAHLLFIKDEEVLTDACWALSYLSDDSNPSNEKIGAVVESGCIRRLVELLMSPKSNSVKTPALRTIGNIVTGDDLQTQAVLQSGALEALGFLLSNEKKAIRKEACWTISNITAGNPDQIESVINAQLIQPLVKLLEQGSFDVRKEAAWAISNATSGGSEQQIRFLVREGVIPPLCELFTSRDNKIAMVALEGIENILRVGEKDRQNQGRVDNEFAFQVEECGGVDHLESLATSEVREIYEKSVELIQTYWGEEDQSGPQPAETSTGFTFDQSGSTNFKFA
jgi:importin subunit alpha-1